MSEDFDTGFKPVSERIKGEALLRQAKVYKSIPFGVNFLDATFRAIEVDDFVLIGASPGVGKTELVTKIALGNALNNKRVYFFALEASQLEIERRMKFALMMQAFQERYGYKLQCSYYDWYRGDTGMNLSDIDIEVDKQMEGFKNLNTFYRDKNTFGILEFRKIFEHIASDADLIVVDHLHYFDLHNENENRAVTDLMKEMRNLVLIHEKPIVLVAHLRKHSSNGVKSLCPDLNDFHGTSEIGKIVTKGITISPGASLGNGRFNTFCKPVKCRQDGSVTRYIINPVWDATKSEYEEAFQIGYDLNGVFQDLGPLDEVPLFMRRKSLT